VTPPIRGPGRGSIQPRGPRENGKNYNAELDHRESLAQGAYDRMQAALFARMGSVAAGQRGSTWSGTEGDGEGARGSMWSASEARGSTGVSEGMKRLSTHRNSQRASIARQSMFTVQGQIARKSLAEMNAVSATTKYTLFRDKQNPGVCCCFVQLVIPACVTLLTPHPIPLCDMTFGVSKCHIRQGY